MKATLVCLFYFFREREKEKKSRGGGGVQSVCSFFPVARVFVFLRAAVVVVLQGVEWGRLECAAQNCDENNLREIHADGFS